MMASLYSFMVTAKRSSPGTRGLCRGQDVSRVDSPCSCSSAGPGLFWLPYFAHSDEILKEILPY